MEEKMDEIRHLVVQFSDLMEQNIRGVKIGCYSVALIGLTVAIRKIRPFSKFKRPSDIPNHFVREHRELTGIVERIEPSGPLLMVQHKPLFPNPFAKKESLPVKVSGINVTGNGLSWLQTIVAGNNIRFIPVLKEKDWVQCEVLLDQQTHDKKLRTINVGENLVGVGFASLTPIEKPLPITDPIFSKYVKRLKAAQEHALYKTMGFQYYIKPTKSVLAKLGNRVGKIVSSTSKKATKIPKIAVS